ncbi:UDP-N-acetylglucosamine 2-epimerase (non-hydrolyzing) [Burkholderia multivorans]|uniref:non-hydrolyzing UDP-N-acetylglucosamine 2-epimerase n=1 Tax=Burkholderia multivorans TaxID=87883 RepID=UPI000CFED6BD|nr:UDP-N-acetylglucosamine 2-epimerase (non-hydrolyzing) [Burkholderia multivorans]MBR8122275.1 UDP-N-acetylglucosamine 2-epimerase (non-hydrolyzing) [Burkholderia multivorans]MBU9455271.1 UDP-N-acetylglucosamine 2-epimerase (non-hydrolyzing) [Burkholderia multivorans]MBU9599896.1 UDP-N-acetylglucosamine 2-epimerase (non-hydrolyzing) [Burkholderia multivorans]MCO1371844.1 UDP-N-acetylglucosamine 2-epimerase (non-hydrolyzing) [Burkholderia multivorans]MCO1456904.1 UDP-N-acetylglucosamine 2-epim
MKVMVVMGTRPEAIKLAPLIAALRMKVDTIVCSSGQHREMLAQALGFFGIAPDLELDVMRERQTLNGLSARLLTGLDAALDDIRPDWVLVQGDTTTAMCGGLAAFHQGIAIGHIEAGLRTGNLASPFPEEANRSLLGRISTLHFAPTEAAARNLFAEGIPESRVLVTGNTVVDAISLVRDGWRASDPAATLPEWMSDGRPQVLVTCHRRENFGDVLESICKMLRELCVRYDAYRWVFPVHLNPAVREPVHRELAGIPNLALIEPVDYPTSLFLISRSVLVVSDSGGIQEEAPSFGVPVVVMRDHTERHEGVDAGFATLAGQSAERIKQAVVDWLDDPLRRTALAARENPYGDSRASQRIVDSLLGRQVEAFRG